MITLEFYIEKDGIRTFTDSYLKYLLDRAEKDGSLEMFLFGDKPLSKDKFFRRIKYDQNCLFGIVKKDEEVAGFGLLDHFRYKTAYGHFCMFQEFWGNGSVAIAREVYRQLLNKFSVLIGVVPERNKYAIKFCEKIGMEWSGVIPNYFFDENIDEYSDGVMFHITKEV